MIHLLLRRLVPVLVGACALFVLGGSAPPHPLHLGVLDLNYRPADHALEVMVRLFRDDLANALSRLTGNHIRIDLTNARDADIAAYIHSRVRLQTPDGQAIAFKWIGREAADDAEWCYFEATGIDRPLPLRVKNTLFFELFDDQNHFVHYSVNGGHRTSLRLNEAEPEAVID